MEERLKNGIHAKICSLINAKSAGQSWGAMTAPADVGGVRTTSEIQFQSKLYFSSWVGGLNQAKRT